MGGIARPPHPRRPSRPPPLTGPIAARRKAQELAKDSTARIKPGNTLELFEKLEVTDFPKAAGIMLSGYLADRSVAILQRPENNLYLGSGLCLRIADRYYAATAKHNLEHEGRDLSLSEIEVKARGEKYGLPLKVRSVGKAPDRDVAWLELDPEAAKHPLLKFVSPDETASFDENKGQQACALLGYPAEIAEKPLNAQQPLLLESACMITLSIAREDRRRVADLDSFCIEWPPRDRSLDEMIPMPQGVSGCGVWLLPRHDDQMIWSPELARLVGLETSWRRADRELVVVRIERWLEAIATAYHAGT
jgi:hypothetical protein